VYSAVVRSALCFGASAWHKPSEDPAKVQGLANQLEKHQNRCLRTVAGAYKATPIRQLETETFIPLLAIYLNRRIAAYHLRQDNSGVRAEIRQACSKIRGRLLSRRRKASLPTPAVAKEAWARSWRGEAQTKEELDKKMLEEWQARWRATRPARGQLGARPPDPTVLQLHRGLHKAESSVLIQARTEKIGFAQFLRQRQVPGVTTDQCSCNTGIETVQHVVEYCIREMERRDEIRRRDAIGSLDFRWLSDTNEGARRLSKWLIQGRRLQQFSLADTLLYG
jgi:hypothetical protein